MRGGMPSPAFLEQDDRVVIVGGGPAGSFFAVYLLREAWRLGRRISVLIIERRGAADPKSGAPACCGCNFCAGIISPRLNEVLERAGLRIPADILQGVVDYVWIQGQWKNFRLRVPKPMRMYSVFRGSLPSRRIGRPGGFDGFLLGEAIREGATILEGEAQAIAYSRSGKPQIAVRTRPGELLSIEAEFVAVAAGINAPSTADSGRQGLSGSLRRLNPDFAPGRSRRALICELEVGEEYLRRHLHREVYFVEYGSTRLDVEHAALVPKGRYLTLVLIGQCIDRAEHACDRRRVAHDFLTLPQIERILPGIGSAPVSCACAPRMTVAAARCPFGDRFAVIGDAAGSRLNKDGLYSAHVTATRLAETVLHRGIDRRSLAREYGKTMRWLAADNFYGRIVFALSRAAFQRPLIGRVMYQAFATEYKVRDESRRPFGAVLWKIASGTADYRDVLRDMCGLRVLGSILVGAAVTLRNVACEWLFGLRWGEYGRYPTVVVKERRLAVKQRLAEDAGRALGASPDFERMYVIKIRGSEAEIIEELGKVGDPGAPFLNVRFLEVRRVRGDPNQVGSVVRYRIPATGLRTELRLVARHGFNTLVYEVDRRLSDNGVLLFNVRPTKDGNRKLTIYAAFDYKKGAGLAGRALWRGLKALFPAFVHDVVWNHALCTIKQEVERLHDSAGAQAPVPDCLTPKPAGG